VHRLYRLVVLAAVSFSVLGVDRTARGQGNLFVLGVALNQQPDKASGQTIDSYNWCPQEIDKIFREQAHTLHRQIQTRLVLGVKATHAGVMDGLAWLRKNTTRNDLVVMYVGCHGSTDPEQGWVVQTADGKQLWGHEIKAQLAGLPCQVLLFIETCTSGGFTRPHRKDRPVPPNVTALCACSGRQTTDNQLDMAVAEALYGRADFNKNGVVELDELIRYVQLRYKEWWPEPKTTQGSNTPVIVKSNGLPGSFKLTRANANLVAVAHKGTWYSALREGQNGNNYRVHLLGWSSRPGPYFLTSSVKREFISLPSEGRPLLVEQGGRWYPARLLARQGANYRVHYLGYNENEVVARPRVFYPFVGELGQTNFPYSSTGAGTWGRLGPAGAWKGTRVGAVLNDRLFTVETNGCLYVTDLSTGTWKEVGKQEFGDTVLMFAAAGSLYTIEKSGSLYRVNPKNGTWIQVGAAGAWKNTQAAAVLGNRLYTVNAAGRLAATDLANGRKAAVGKPEFGATAAMFAAGNFLYTVERDGSLYRVNLNDGSWGRLGKAEDWKGTRVGAVLKGKLYTVEGNGCLYATDLRNGQWKQIGKAEFGGTVGIFAAGSKVFTIEKDGSLYWVAVR
jgi:hypothetical protein